MKKKIIISITIFVLVFTALNINNAKANDPCFDGMCSISVNITTGKTTKTRLSDAEIAIRLAAKAESDRLAAIAKAEADRLAAIEAANKPAPVIIETSTATTQPTPVVETSTVISVILTETITAQTATATAVATASVNTNTSTQANVVVETKTATVETTTASAAIQVATAPVLVTKLSDVIWVLKNQIIMMQKLYAKILIRTKGKK